MGGVALASLDHGLLDVVLFNERRGSAAVLSCAAYRIRETHVDVRLLSGHEEGTAVHSASSERDGSGESTSVSDSSRGEIWDVERLGSEGKEDETSHIVFSRVTSALESVDGKHVNAELYGRLGVADGGAL